MHRKKVALKDVAGQLVEALPNGILLTTKTDGKVNTMTIGWGTLGINWGEPCFCAYVREGRFTAEQLAKNPQFTISAPVGDYDKKIIGVAGSTSGRNTDKIAQTGVTLVPGEKIGVPAIAELPLTLECEVVYKQHQKVAYYSKELLTKWYPQDVPSSATGKNKDPHIMVFGKIVDAYILED